jgi:hypothetical protein
MAIQYDVLAAHTETSGTTLVAGRARIKGYQCLSGGTAGDIIFRNGGASGPILLQFNVPANTNNPFSTTLPGDGILFNTNIYVTFPASTKVTIFYG